MAQLGERAKRYEKNYRNERKKAGWVARHFEAAKQKLRDMTSSQDTMENLLHKAQVQLELKENEASQLKESKEQLEKWNGGLCTHIS